MAYLTDFHFYTKISFFVSGKRKMNLISTSAVSFSIKSNGIVIVGFILLLIPVRVD